MKRIFAVLLCCVMIFSFAACGADNDNGSNKNPFGGTQSDGTFGGVKLSDKHVNESQKMEVNLAALAEIYGEEAKVTPNGSLPDNKDDVSVIDKRYYFNEALNALITLDEKGMKTYLPEEDAKALMELKNDQEAYALWQRTIGNISYLPSGQVWYCRPIYLMYAMWYMDQAKNNATLKEHVSMLTYAELAEIYNEYYDKVPVVVQYCTGPDDYYIENGNIKFEMTEIFLLLGISDVTKLLEEDSYRSENGIVKHNHLYELVLTWQTAPVFTKDSWNDYDHILDDGEFKLYEAFMNKDLDAMEAIMDVNPDAWNDIDKSYKTYIENSETRAAFQTFLNERVITYRCYDETYFIVKVNTDYTYGTRGNDLKEYATDKEKALLLSTQYYNAEEITASSKLDRQWENTFGELIEFAIENGIFKDIG